MGISRQQLTALNNHPDLAVRIENAGPEQEYMATFDVLHQLHCVVSTATMCRLNGSADCVTSCSQDLLRKGIHMDYYKDRDEHFVNQTEERIFFHLGKSHRRILPVFFALPDHTANSSPRPLC